MAGVITNIVTPRRIRLAGFATGAVALASAAVYVTASAAGYNLNLTSSSTQGTLAVAQTRSGTASAVCNDFAAHFATNLGTTQAKVDAAFQQAVGQTLADEVKNGTLTQSQADAMQARLAGKAPCALASGIGAPTAGPALHSHQLLRAAASALGITPEQLRGDLANGMTLSQIAAAENPPVTEAQFRTRLVATIKPLLDAQVANQRLTSAQEQKILQGLQTGPIPFWDKPIKKATAAGA